VSTTRHPACNTRGTGGCDAAIARPLLKRTHPTPSPSPPVPTPPTFCG
jgi:hypothetical protein